MTAIAASMLLAVAATPAAPPPAPAQRTTTMLGSSDNQFYIAKISVTDLPRSYAFYTQVIGLKRAMGPGQPTFPPPSAADNEKPFVEIPLNVSGSLADPIFVLTKRKGISPTREQAAMITIGFKVPNAREALTRAAAAGYPAKREPMGSGPMAFAFVEDPDGHQIEFVQAPPYPQSRRR